MFTFIGPKKNFKLLIKTAIEWLTFLFVKSDERQMNCLPITISHALNHAELKESCFMSAAYGVHTRFQKIKKSKLFENLNDAYIMSMPMFAT